MKRNLLLTTLAAIGMMAACQKTGPETQPGTDPGIIDDGKPVAVQFGLGGVSLEAGFTKSSGVVGGVGAENNKWNGQKLYIYGIDREVTDYTEDGALFMENVEAKAPEGPTSSASAKLTIYRTGSEPYYYSGKSNYDFYGYYVDDATLVDDAETPDTKVPAVPAKEADKISVPFTINGGQDILLAKADQQADIDAVFKENPDDKIAAERAYSAYAARRGVHPTLSFKHQLTRFTFDIVPGAEGAEAISVTAIKIKSASKGTLTIVGETPGVVFTDIEAEAMPLLSLMELDTVEESPTKGQLVELKPISPAAFDDAKGKNEQQATRVGESLIVYPGQATYELALSMKQTGATVGIEDQKYTLNIGDLVGPTADPKPTVFEAGKSYNIRLVIYSLEDVEITAALEAWENGGDITVDPDI